MGLYNKFVHITGMYLGGGLPLAHFEEAHALATADKLTDKMADAIIQGEFEFKGGLFVPPNASDLIVIPDMAAVDLTALTKRGVRVGDKELPLTSLDPDYERWDFYRGVNGSVIEGRGKTFQMSTWAPGRNVSSEEVRTYFRDRGGFYGHVGAFTEWRRTCGLQGYHASIPPDNACWRYPDVRRLYVPYSRFDDGDRELRHIWIGRGWDAGWVFDAFREVKQP